MKIQVASTLNAFVKSNRAFAQKDFNTKEEIVDDKGNKIYPLSVFLESDGGEDTEVVEISVKGRSNPFDGIKTMTPVVFKNVQIAFGYFNGKKYWKLSADGVKKA